MAGGVCVVIPAYNAQATIGSLVTQVKQLALEAVVINDGSTDRTAHAATAAGAMVISHLHNRGKGAALRTGFAFGVQAGYDTLVTADADGQHDPHDIPKLLEALKSPDALVVIGERVIDAATMPPLRRWTNRVMSRLVSLVAGQPIPDSQCGLRAICRQALEHVTLSATRYEMETELLLAAAQRGWTVHSVPIRTIYNGHHSHIHPLQDGVRFFALLLRYFLHGDAAGLRAQPARIGHGV